MSKETLLFHGSTEIIQRPEYGKGRKNNDYGLGFYCTEDPDLAGEWACSSNRDGFSNRYSMDLRDMNVLRLNDPEYSILNWIAVLLKNRTFRIRTPIAGKAKKYLIEYFSVSTEAYDVIIGYRADDSYYDFADAFLNNGITLGQLSRAMALGKLGEQVVVKSEYAFEQLKFMGFEKVNGELYYPARKARNDKAMRDYMSLAEEIEEGIFVNDIIKEGIRNEDLRISGNIFE